MNKNYTDGKWKVVQDETYPTLHQIWNNSNSGDIPTFIARTCYAPKSEANAKLIAAAPDMLEALQNLENDDNSIPECAWKMVKDAIAKATGISQIVIGFKYNFINPALKGAGLTQKNEVENKT